MTNITHVLAIVLFVASVVKAELIAEPGHIDFGTITNVAADDEIRQVFHLRNTGQSAVTILMLRPSCGCISVAPMNGRVIKPGDTLEIPVSLDALNYSGRIREEILVMTSASPMPSYRLVITGNIEKVVSVKPSTLHFGEIGAGESSRQTADLIVETDMVSFDIIGVESDNPAVFQASLETIKAGKAYRVHVTATAPDEIGRLQSTVHIKTNQNSMPSIAVGVTGNRVPAIKVTPARVVLRPSNEPHVTQSRSIRIQSSNGEPFDVLNAALRDAADVKVNVTKLGADDYRVDLTQIRTADLENERLMIETNHPLMASVEVPIEVTEK